MGLFYGLSVTQGLALANDDLAVIAGESILDQSGIRFGGEDTDYGNDHKTGQDAESAGVNGRLQQSGEGGTKEDVGHHDHSGEEGAGPTGSLSSLFLVQAELSGVSYKDHSGEVRGTVCKGGQPRADGSSAQNKTIYISGVLAAIQSNAHHDAEESYEHCDLDQHRTISSYSAFMR